MQFFTGSGSRARLRLVIEKQNHNDNYITTRTVKIYDKTKALPRIWNGGSAEAVFMRI